jgi:hypothetical protein
MDPPLIVEGLLFKENLDQDPPVGYCLAKQTGSTTAALSMLFGNIYII